MSEETNPQAGAGTVVRLLGQRIKDLSFENPGVERNPNDQRNPDIDLSIDVSGRRMNSHPDLFESDLKILAKAQLDDKVFFIMELVYTGTVEIRGVAEQDLEPIMLIEIPRLLFPFARRVVADITREGGFPPLFIEPVDFASLYTAQRQAKAQAAPAAPAETNGTV